MVSLVLSRVLSAMGHLIVGMLPGDFWGPVLWVSNVAVSFVVFALLFAAIFKVMPDADVAWRDVWVGAATTAVLFLIGKFLIGIYLGMGDVGAAYGAAGSLVLILVWIYYSSLILLIGAEFTQVWARRHGKRIEPSEGAVRMVRETHAVRTDGEHAREPKPHAPARESALEQPEKKESHR
jgi:membrane protein